MTRRTPVAARPDHALIEGHTDNTVAAIRSGFLANLLFTQARLPEHATPNELYLALAATVRDHPLHRQRQGPAPGWTRRQRADASRQ